MSEYLMKNLIKMRIDEFITPRKVSKDICKVIH